MKKSSLFIIAITLSSSILFSSCGVIFGGSRYNANIIVKDHPNADIYANGQKVGTGSTIQSFKRNEPLYVEVKQDKCEPKEQTFTSAFRAGNFLLSLFSWGLIGVAIDLGTGASYKPNHVNDKAIEKVTDKDYVFRIDYSECKEK